MFIFLFNKHHTLGRGQRARLKMRRHSFVILDEFVVFFQFFSICEAIEACAFKIAHPEGRDWSSLWTLTQESYRDEVETVCHNCYVGGSAPQTQKDAFHNLLTDWMGQDYFGDWMMDRKNGSKPPDLDGFKHNQQPLPGAIMRKGRMTTTKLRLCGTLFY